MALVTHRQLDLSENGYDEVDFVAVSPHKMLGGSEAPGILIAKKKAYPDTNTFTPSFPGGGTVDHVLGFNKNT